MAKNGKKWQKMAKIVFFYFFKYILLLPNLAALKTSKPIKMRMSYAAAVSVGAPAPVAPAPVAPAPVAPAPPLSYAAVTAKNAPKGDEDYWGVPPKSERRCNVGHCELCNILRDPIRYKVGWSMDEYGNESGT